MITIVEQLKNVIGQPCGRYQGAILYGTACIFLILVCIALLCIIRWLTKW